MALQQRDDLMEAQIRQARPRSRTSDRKSRGNWREEATVEEPVNHLEKRILATRLLAVSDTDMEVLVDLERLIRREILRIEASNPIWMIRRVIQAEKCKRIGQKIQDSPHRLKRCSSVRFCLRTIWQC